MADLTVNYFNVMANFDSTWERYPIRYVHIHKADDHTVGSDWLLDVENKVADSHGINLTNGEWEIWFHGVVLDPLTLEVTSRITTETKIIKILETGTDGGLMPDIPESNVEQITALAEEAVAIAQDVRDDADAGEFNGATFTPSVSEEGIISWTNDKELPNPTSRNIKGPKGDTGEGVPSGGTKGQVITKGDGDTVEWKDVNYCNENLLDNWYFIRTTSPVGRGVFPINRRGQTTYTQGSTGESYSFDRWYISRCTVKSYSIGIRVIWDESPNTSNGYIGQYIRSPQALIGRTVTFSALVQNELLTSTWTVQEEQNAPAVTAEIGGYSISMRLNFTTVNGTSKPRFVLMSTQVAASETQTIKAVKLELGDKQTLAHKEDNTWVVNEIPDWEEEYIKCATSDADPNDNKANQTVAYLSNIIPNPTVDSIELTYPNTKSLTEAGVIPENGMYYIFLATQIMSNNAASIYYVRYLKDYAQGEYVVTPIFEGIHSEAPRISSTGQLGFNSTSGNNRTIRFAVVKMS